MSLVACPDCQKDVSTEAFVCPHCGRPTGKQAAVQKKFFLRVFFMWLALIVVFLAIWQLLGAGG